MSHAAPRLLICLLLLVAGTAHADWPGYRGDNGRRGFSDAAIDGVLHLHWRNHLAPLPAPAWPAPARGSLWQNLDHIEARVTDDAAYHPVIAQGRVLFASSANDHLYCLDAETGDVAWSFVADAPIRYAPAVDGERVYFGSDDGLVRCVSLDSGELIWSYRIGPDAGLIPGNGRLISPWPLRTGVLVDDGSVYACAGLFPSQGTFAVSLSADDGGVNWKQNLGDRSPQGYLLASQDTLFVPTGRTNPFAIDRATGRVGRAYGSPGGSFAILADDQLISGPGNDNTLQATAPDSAQSLISYRGKHMVVGPQWSYMLTGDKVFALDRIAYTALSQQALAVQQQLGDIGDDEAQREQIVALQRQLTDLQRQVTDCVKWEAATTDTAAMIVAGGRVFVGGEGVITAYDAATGRKLRAYRIDGTVGALAADEGLLVVTTDAGAVMAFREGRPAEGIADIRPLRGHYEIDDIDRQLPPAWLAGLANPRGIGVVLGDITLGQLDAMIEETELRLAVVTDNAVHAAFLREVSGIEGFYGSRVTVHLVDDHTAIPIADYVVNLAVVLDEAWPHEEVMRILSPGRGVAVGLYDDGTSVTRPPLEGAGSWTHQYANAGNTSNSGEANLTGRVALQWFGGPGPSRMIDRHLRGPPPLAFAGKVIMVGENVLIGVDAYNGTELWETELPDSQRYAMPYDAGYLCTDKTRIFAAVDHEVWVINAETGERTGRIPLPPGIDPERFHWGYLNYIDGSLLGSAMHIGAAITVADRTVPDTSYRSVHPLVTSAGLFRIEVGSRRPAWTRSGGAIVHGTIAVQGDTVYFVESRNDTAKNDADGSLSVQALLASEAYLVALDFETGELKWEQPVDQPNAHNILYLAASACGKLVMATSNDAPGDRAHYHIAVLDAADGSAVWSHSHLHVKGGLYHGEQVHHPVILGDRLVAEPVIYDLNTGVILNPDGGPSPWSINRPGHSCGTMSGAGDYLFFRASNPTMLDLTDQVTGTDRFTRLAPSRAGCWINVLPAQGLVLIPEASASCVCQYSLQTSMAFRPVPMDAPDPAAPKPVDEPLEKIYGWRFTADRAQGDTITPDHGPLPVTRESEQDFAFTDAGLTLDARDTLLSVQEDDGAIPELPANTLTLEAVVRIDSSTPWSGILGATQDNGSFERGFLLGIHEQKFFFSLATDAVGTLTYLEAPSALEFGQAYHLAATYDGVTMTLYIDGEPVASSAAQSGPIAHAQTGWLAVGAYRDDNETYPMDGAIHSAAIYRGAMDGSTVREHADALE